MDMLSVQGGRPLVGHVRVSGAKNAALPIMAATLAIPGCTILENIPVLRDIASMTELLGQLGVRTEPEATGGLAFTSTSGAAFVADYELVRKMRASVCVLGPLLASRGEACVSLPGGCNIGLRPIDLHLRGLVALGAEIEIRNGYVQARAARLRGARIHLSGPQGSTVTGTCNVMTAATLARGITQIEAAACEPEVADLGHFLQACGARIEGLGTPLLTIEGVDTLYPCRYAIIPDRIEAATWMIAAAITRGQVTVEHCQPETLTAVIEHLRLAGADVLVHENRVTVRGTARPRAGALVATPYPGFPTDVQAQWTALMSLAEGVGIVTDHVFPERFMHAAELMRMGAQIRREANSVIIQGVPQLSAASVMASDLRASAALVLAALAAEGESTIRRIYHLDRGYERLDEKLRGLGAIVERKRDPESVSGASSPLRQPHWSRPGNPSRNTPQ
ncbi:MAG: UDP-N-acetylglucosamine 1-carboxyvinyltransferase [Planctomycetaceae bacterium]|nr:UDP-N-acetylglucosamine 1-carboxyvinyltransferase [Planctomycetaceae bacterium]